MTETNKSALLLIDIQNDYFDGFAFPLWEAGRVLEQCVAAVEKAKAADIPVFLIQHVADASKGMAPFFNQGTEGVAIHQALLDAAPDATIVQKSFADGFLDTDLGAQLMQQGIETLLIGGMMTQNCVTHTAISKQAEPYNVKVLGDLSTTVSEILHLIALNALAPRVTIADWQDTL